MNLSKHLIILTALLLTPLAALHGSEVPAKPTAQVAVRMPAFSWDTVSRALFMHKPTPWTDEDYAHIARHDFLQTDVNEKAVAMAAEVKKFNPGLIIIGYKNLVLHVQTTADPVFRDHPDWFLYSRGKLELNGSGRNKRPMYDLRKAEVRSYWIQDVERILNMPIFDGIFFDAYAKVVDYAPVKRATGQEPPMDFIAAYHQMMDEHLKHSGQCGKIRIGNFLRADKEACAIPEVMKYLDGSYLEWFDHHGTLPPHIHSYEEYLAAGIQAVQQVAQAGKIIVLHLEAADDKDIKVTADGADPATSDASSSRYNNFEYKLALFLICAERYSYFQYQGAYKVTEDFQAWAPEFPEFKKPLGPPKGPAVKNGFTYTREFQYASVWLDLAKRQGRITWKASYPQAKMLSPRHGDDQVPVGALECRIDFDRAIKKGTGTISLHRLSDRQKLASVLVESDAVLWPDDKTVIVRFPAGVEAKTQYSITVDKGAFLDGKNMKFLGMPVLGEWRFTTRSQ
ncbi:MAG: putative glycoside hydrolase [Kiritimatiellaeota bacterium]|nr:putative glycoside hydrolase [Kiritimatiellota bacterium]